jgi:hypothetical protein
MNVDAPTWRLTEPPSPDGDAVVAALGLDAAKLRCGPVQFDFTKARTPSGELVLTLRRDGDAHAVDPMGLLEDHEQVIPKASERLSAEARDSAEVRYLRVLGRLLFDDVAHLVGLELELP